MKLLLLATIALLAYQAQAGAFKKDSIILLGTEGSTTSQTSTVVLKEYRYDGLLLQTITLGGYVYSKQNVHKIMLDYAGSMLAIGVLEGDPGLASTSGMPRVALTVNANGAIVDRTKITDFSNQDANFYFAVHNGQDIWLGYDGTVGYTTRGATSLITPSVSSRTNIQYVQIVGNTFFTCKAQSGFAFWSMPSPPKVYSADYPYGSSVPYTAVTAFSSTIWYGAGAGKVAKMEASANGFTDIYATGVDTFSSRSVIARQFGTVVYVFVLTTDGWIYRYTDSGSGFTERRDIISGDGTASAYLAFSPNPSCDDSGKNQDETDIDCGGTLCNKCDDGKICAVLADCYSDYCNPNKTCSTPSCSDGFKNQVETDVDCGGGTCSKCANAKTCSAHTDCTSGFCNPNTNKCAAPSCSDTFKNGDETDTDCGGSCSKCSIGNTCSINGDCASNKCSGNKCVISCSDGVKNQDETDIDCGGATCSACVNGKSCLLGSDCTSEYCNPDNKCSTPSCSDGYLNQDETDIDCGGSCSDCAVGQNCLYDTDCLSKNCTDTKCQYSCVDGILNQDESDIDCGGSCATKCALNQVCHRDSDCQSGFCPNASCMSPPVAGPVAPPVASPVASPFADSTPDVGSAPQIDAPQFGNPPVAVPTTNTQNQSIVSGALTLNSLTFLLLVVFVCYL